MLILGIGMIRQWLIKKNEHKNRERERVGSDVSNQIYIGHFEEYNPFLKIRLLHTELKHPEQSWMCLQLLSYVVTTLRAQTSRVGQSSNRKLFRKLYMCLQTTVYVITVCYWNGIFKHDRKYFNGQTAGDAIYLELGFFMNSKDVY